jgi:hypothetical protein
MAQRGDRQRRTRFLGGVDITLRGAGSSGNDPLKVGAGADTGLDIQIPTAQTKNSFQISQPDGTVVYAIGPNGNGLVTAVTASGALAVANGSYVIIKAGVAALTLAAPTAGTQDGTEIQIISNTAFAHTLTATGLLQTGTASVNVATFAAFAGAGLVLVAYQGKWNVTSSVAITFS